MEPADERRWAEHPKGEAQQTATALVFGATGYTGHAIVELWSKRGPVVAHVRPGSRAAAHYERVFQTLGVSVEQVPWEEASIGQLVARVRPEVVFSVLGTTRARAKDDLAEHDQQDPYAAVDERLTIMAAQAVKQQAPDALFVYLSALGVSSTTENRYLAARYRVETHLAQSGLRYVVARPAFVTGSDRSEFRLGERVAAVVSDGVLNALAKTGVGRLRTLRNKFASLTGEQLARALVSLALSPPTTPEVLPDELRRRAKQFKAHPS